MPRRSAHASGSRRLAVLLLVIIVPPAATLIWLGVQFVQQDRVTLAQRHQERRQATGQAAIRALDQSLARVERALADGTRLPGVVRFRATADTFDAEPADMVAWLPIAGTLRPAESRLFAETELLEYQNKSNQALEAYRRWARSPHPPIAAGALVREARVLRRQEIWDEALDAYRRLARLTGVSIDGWPADLVGRRALCDLLHAQEHRGALRIEADEIERDLLAGKWPLDRASWELVAEDIRQWTGRALPAGDRTVFSEVAAALFQEWQVSRGTKGAAAGRILVAVQGSDTPVTVVWRDLAERRMWAAVSPAEVKRWAEELASTTTVSNEIVTLMGPNGTLLSGPPQAGGASSTSWGVAETGLPWTIVVAGDQAPFDAEYARRRRLIALGLISILTLLGGGSYFLWRVVQRDLAVARQQADFVATVSHEFRTPLASLRHLTELLEEDDDLPVERRRSFYQAFARNTERLQRMVESLLDFAQMESGRKPYDLRPVDLAHLADRVVADFKRTSSRNLAIDFQVRIDGARELRVDVPSLTSALWNLLDNAVKYSPEGGIIRVSLDPHADGVAISVRDTGLGIPHDEQREIFRRFVRGRKARELGIRGTGLGLAMVAHIVRAHGGTVEVDSQEGAGSTFRVILPA